MGRLTEKDTSGRWMVKGIPWEKLQAGETLTEETSRILYGCLCKLKDYEDSRMNPEQAGHLQYELEEVAAHVCDELCRHPWEITEQEEQDAVCKSCPLNAYVKRVLDMGTEEQGKDV